MRVFLRVYPIVFFLISCLGSAVYAQDLSPTYIEAKILQGSTYEFDFFSTKPIDIIEEENIANGNSHWEEISLNLEYKFIYQSDPDFIGESTFVVERTSVEDRTLNIYTQVRVKVVPSLLEAMHDIAVIAPGGDEVTIDVLANDIPGSGSTSLISFDLVTNGSASVVDDKIVFTKAIGFSGQTSFNYLIQDDSGYKSNGVITVEVMDESLAGKTLNYTTSSLSSVDIILDDPSYSLEEGVILSKGSLSNGDINYKVYQPNILSSGIETFDLVNGQGDRVTIHIEILDGNDQGLLVRDDVYYTGIGSTISFNPRENDYSQDGVVLTYSEELFFDGENFTFTPEPDFSGVVNASYTILDGQKEIKGAIEIYVGDYLPLLDLYQFEMFEDSEFLIEYLSPISGYSWTIVEDAFRGTVNVDVSSRTSVCGSASGVDMISYAPRAGYTGQDDFTLEYCAPSGSCKQVRIEMNILSSNDCHCFGSDCVWAGDADNDGKVSVIDLLSIGYNYGDIGPARSSTSDNWAANYADDWAFNQEESNLNNKYADANGDGIINTEDVDVLHQNLNQYHSITANEVIALKDIPLSFEGPPSAQAGEQITFEVFLGNDDIPAIDIKGIAFSSVFPSDLVDANSIKFTPDHGWLGNGSPVLTATHRDNGLLEVALTRTSSVGVSGNGRLGEISLVVKVDIDGYAPFGDDLPFDIAFEKALVSNYASKKYKVRPQMTELVIERQNKFVSNEGDILIYPNPSFDQLNFEVDKRDQINTIDVYNVIGERLIRQTNLSSSSFRLTHNLAQGVYIAHVETNRGTVVRKVQVVRQ